MNAFLPCCLPETRELVITDATCVPVYIPRKLFRIPMVYGSVAPYTIFESRLLSWLIQSSHSPVSLLLVRSALISVYLYSAIRACVGGAVRKTDFFLFRLPLFLSTVLLCFPRKNLPSNYFLPPPGCDSAAWVHFNKQW